MSNFRQKQPENDNFWSKLTIFRPKITKIWPLLTSRKNEFIFECKKYYHHEYSCFILNIFEYKNISRIRIWIEIYVMFQNNVPEVQLKYLKVIWGHFEFLIAYRHLILYFLKASRSSYFIFIKIFVMIIWLIQIDLTWPQMTPKPLS